MKTETSGTEAFFALLIGVPLAILVSMYGTLLITKVVEWYSIPVTLTFKQWFGIDSLVGVMLLGMKAKNNDKWYNTISVSVFVITFLFATLWITSKIL